MDRLDGVGTEVVVQIAAPPAEVWALVTDLSRTPDWNRETQLTEWLEPHRAAAPGARFRALNQIGDWRWEVECTVTRADDPVAFEWTVGDPAHPSTRWWHRLAGLDGGTELRHGFQHGPAGSGLRAMVDQDPDDAEALIERRVEMLRSNMRHTLDLIKAHAERSTGG